MEMRPIFREGGRAWEWDHSGLTYKVESLDGSPNVHVYTVVTTDPGHWEFKFSRPTKGFRARDVAQHICDEVVAGLIDPISREMKNVAIALFGVRLTVTTDDGMTAVGEAVTAIGDAFWPDNEELRNRWVRMCLNTAEIQQ